MPGYPDDTLVSRPRDYRHDRRPRRDYDGYDDDIYRRPAAAPRGPSYEPPRPTRGHRRRDQYDASDEEDDYVPRRRPKEDREADKAKAHGDPEIPPPPIGEDRTEYATAGRKGRKADAAAFEAVDDERRRSYKDARRSRERRDDTEAERMPERKSASKKAKTVPSEDESDAPQADRKQTQQARTPYEDGLLSASERKQRKVERPPYESGQEAEAVARKPSRRYRDDYEDIEPPRRHKARDPYEEDPPPPRRRDPYAEPPRHRERRTAHAPEDSDEYDAPPRRRDDRDRRRYENGYGTDRPRRAARDDPYERGYRTDGRDARRDRDRYAVKRDPRRDGRRREDRYADDHDDRPDKRKSRNGKHGAFDMNDIMHKSQKTWEKAAPVAKPLLAQLANTYLNNGRAGGGVPH